MAEVSFDIEGNEWILRCSPRATALAKLVPSLHHDRRTDTWRGPATLAGALAARGVFGEALDVSEAAYDRVAAFNADAETRAQVLRVEDAEFVRREYGLPEILFPFQVGSTALMSRPGWFINCDDRGNGKTPQAAVAAMKAGGPTLVVCTKSMLHVWAGEVERFTTLTPYVLDGTAPQRVARIAEAREHGADAVLIITWDSLKKHTLHAHYGSVKRKPEHVEPGPLNGGWIRTVIADEAHKAKDPKAQQTRALWAVGDTARTRIALTATPITDTALDLWGILRFLDPESFPSKSKYRDRYVLTVPRYYGTGEPVLEDLGLNPVTRAEFDRIFLPHYVRRPLQNEVKTLPPQVRWVEMTSKQRSAYKAMQKRMVAAVDSGIMVASDALVRDTRLHQIAAATPVLGDEYADEDGNLRVDVVALEEPSCKIDALFELLDEQPEDPLVVFAESRKLIELAYNALTLADGRPAKKGRLTLPQDQVGLITGQVPASLRSHHVDEFQAGNQRVMLLTIGAGSEGITLTRANHAAFLQRSYRAISNIQAEGRVLRLGQDRDVLFTDVVTIDSIEARVHEAIDRKEANLQDLVHDEGWVRRNILGA